MSAREVALEFIRRFCAGDIDGLGALLADDLRFSGPLHRSSTAAAYLASLRQDAPVPCDFRLRAVTEGDDGVSIYYDYMKPGGAITIAQLFKFRDGRICEILLVFDTLGFGRGDGDRDG